ncbi:MAG: nitroreductase family protein [Clostridium sp.]|nr:nitroreductase family protein [Clostridium sp.]
MGYKSFSELIKARKSSNNYIEGIEITEAQLNEIFEDLSLVPSCFNLQHAKYIVVRDKGIKEVFRNRACHQYKVHTASAVVIVLGNKEAYKDAEKLYEPMKTLGMMDELEYTTMVQNITSLYESRGDAFKYDEAIRNASLSAMMFMLIAKDRGWDTCPMIGFDVNETKKLFHIEDKYEPVLLITLGKEDPNNIRLRGYRKPISELVKYI